MEAARMKSSNAFSKLLAAELIPKRIFDSSAQTSDEIARFTGMTVRTSQKHILALVKSGKLEKVWKRGKERVLPAYRIAVKR
jgi:Fic family protein